MKPYRGFKLIELLVVLACLGIALLVLYPGFVHSKRGPYRSICQSNLKQISLDCLQYIGDNDGQFPYATGDGSAATTCSQRYGWAGSLGPYLKVSEIFQCPQEPTRPSSNGCPTLGPYWRDYTDYAFNDGLSGLPRKFLASPDATVVLQDGAGGNGAYHAEAEVLNSAANARHMEGSNYAFGDGHVKWLRAGEVTGTYSFMPWSRGSQVRHSQEIIPDSRTIDLKSRATTPGRNGNRR